ncbi:MAG: RNA methyltransferase [Mariprofundaceae bacterium]
MNQPYHFYAVVLPGLEALVEQELTTFSAHSIRVDEGGVHFAGTLDLLYRVSLRARCITRILIRVGKCQVMTAEGLQYHVSTMAWQNYLPKGANVSVKVSAEKSKLMHSEVISEAVHKGIADALGKRLQKKGNSEQCVYVRITNNRCEIRVDASGERLDRRGYRLQTAKAPLRETLAAGVLQWMQWDSDAALLVPMCGSGTLAIEAALMAKQCAPNINHAFPFKDWDVFKEKAWKRVLERTIGMQKNDLKLNIQASDIHTGAVSAVQDNAQRADVVTDINITQQDVMALSASVLPDAGLIVCNPPYGLRIEADSMKFYQQLGQLLKREFSGWRVAVLCPDWKHEKALSMPVKRRLHVSHGGLWLDVLDVSSETKKQA